MIKTKFFKGQYAGKDYAEAAHWCNENGAMIVDQGDYYEVVEIPAPPLDEIRERAAAAAQAAFAKRRDAVRWVNGYGFDCAPEDITNFMAAYTPLLVAGEGQTQYKVWLTEKAKGIVTLTLAELTDVYRTVRTSQLEAYAWYETVKAQIEAAASAEEIAAILAAESLTESAP